MVNVYLNLSIFTVFLKNKNIIFNIRRSKVTDYAALRHHSWGTNVPLQPECFQLDYVWCQRSFCGVSETTVKQTRSEQFILKPSKNK